MVQFHTFTIRARPNERQDANRVKYFVEINPEHVVSINHPTDPDGYRGHIGCDILLVTGALVPVDENRVDVRHELEGNSG